MKYDYDIIIVGGGAAGLTAAKTAKGFGKRVAILEKEDRLGGECTWTGCIPSKTLIKTAQVAWHTKHMDTYGLRSKNPIELDLETVMPYVRAIIAEDYKSHTPEVIRHEGIDVLFGAVEFINGHQITLDNRPISFGNAIITTGSHPFVPSLPGLEDVPYLTNENLFSLERLPQSIIILGAGAIGAEMASALNRLGVKVTLIEMHDRILPKEDEEVVALVADTMAHEGVIIISNARAKKVEQHNNMVTVTLENKDKTTEKIQAERILITVGRRPNIEGLHLEQLGIKINKYAIETDRLLRTCVKNIYAAGDVVGPYQFSHMAWYQGMVAARNASIPFFKKKINYDHVAWVTFTAPELARMGLTERQAREQIGDITVFRKPYKDIDRAVTDRTTNGLAKYIVNKKGILVGAHIAGARAGELVDELQFAVNQKIPFYTISNVIHVYPTYAEINWHVARQAYIYHLKKKFFVKLLTRFFIKS